MKKGLGVLFVILGLIMIVGFSAVGTYNGLVKTREGVDAAWAQVLSQYQRRADLVPNLVKTVEGSANFEKSTLESVVNARASVGRVNIDTSKAPEDRIPKPPKELITQEPQQSPEQPGEDEITDSDSE